MGLEVNDFVNFQLLSDDESLELVFCVECGDCVIAHGSGGWCVLLWFLSSSHFSDKGQRPGQPPSTSGSPSHSQSS